MSCWCAYAGRSPSTATTVCPPRARVPQCRASSRYIRWPWVSIASSYAVSRSSDITSSSMSRSSVGASLMAALSSTIASIMSGGVRPVTRTSS